MTTPDQQISKLEVLVMEHEQSIDTYSELLQDHQAQIDTLMRKLESLEQKLSKYAESGGESNHDIPPPHY